MSQEARVRLSVGWRGLGLVLGGVVLAVSALAVTPAPGEAQEDWCERTSNWNSDRERFCEVRESAYSAPGGGLRVDGGANGGVSVEGYGGSEVRVTAIVSAWAEDEDRANEIGQAIEISMDGDELRADGPNTGRRESWSVSFRVQVPREMDLELSANNGGIGVEGVHGRIRFGTTNGGISLREVGGDVKGQTTNGGVSVTLDGDRWNGSGLDVKTTNGGVKVSIPEGYSADFETGTTNGSLNMEFPVTVSGRIGRELRTTLGDGGPPIRVITTNGGVRVSRN